MKRLLILLLLVQPALALNIDYSLDSSSYLPGDTGAVVLKISSPSGISSLEISVKVPSGMSFEKTYADIGSVSPGSVRSVSFPFTVLREAEAGVKSVLFEISYFDGSPKYTELTVPVKISPRPVLILSNVTFSDPPVPGGKTVLKVRFENMGGDIEDLRASINQTFFVSPSPDFFVKLIRSGETFEMDFPVILDEELEPGLYSVPLFLEYRSGNKLFSETRILGVRISGEPELSLEVLRDISGAVVKVVNTGTGTASRTFIEFSGPVEPDFLYLGDIAPDDYESGKIKVEAKPGTYEIAYRITYFTSGVKKTLNGTFKVSVPSSGGFESLIIIGAVAGVILFLLRRRK
ncbi:MAG: hypothetical protein GXO63_02795 [Candidatus Micrarchaeota archaeon]|nr:hypothetical protein [Candidatus Micrarchaeota archaeon]